MPHAGKSYDDSVPEHQRRTRDNEPLGRPAHAAAGLAVPGAFFAFLAALAGVGTHGLVAPSSLAHAPSFDAIFLLTAGAVALGAGSGALVGVAARLAGMLPGWAGRATSLAAGARVLGLLLPVTAGQWFAHTVLEADHMLAGGSGASGAGAAGAGSALHGGHGLHAGHAVPANGDGDVVAASGALAGGPAHSGGAEMVPPMLIAHAAGVLVCLAVSLIVRRAMRRLVGRVTAALLRPTLPSATRAILGSALMGGGLSGFAPAEPRAPPSLLALAA